MIQLFFGATALIGAVFLLAALLVRWTTAAAGWRAAMFSAGFGLIVLGGLAPASGSPVGLLMLVIAAAAQLFVGLSALARGSRF